MHAGEAIGRGRVNAPVTFGLLHLASLWPAFMALHPKVELEITLADCLVDLVDEGYDLASGALVEVLPQYRSVALGVYAVYPSRKHLTPEVRVLIDFLVESFRMRAWPD